MGLRISPGAAKIEGMFDSGERAAARVHAAAERLAQLETFSPLVRDGVARVMRVAAAEMRKGRPLPLRLNEALDDLVATIDTESAPHEQDESDWA